MSRSGASFGKIQVRITSADVNVVIKLLIQNGLVLTELQYISELCVVFLIESKQRMMLERLLAGRAEQFDIMEDRTIKAKFRNLKNRWVILIGIICLAVFSIWIPTRVLFITVSGNTDVPTSLILDQAMTCGLNFGCERKALRSEQIKNELIQSIPQLAWVGVTTDGCVATITVKEKQLPSQKTQRQINSSIVASCQGVVQSITVTKGTALCHMGQVVYPGQVLISGYEDRGISVSVTGAQGEVVALTNHQIEGISPLKCIRRGEAQQKKTYFTLQIGKNFINLFKDSGISPASCVKMYSKNYLTLPGGFQLPIALVKEEVISYDASPFVNGANDYSWVSAVSRDMLIENMLSGRILRETTISELLDKVFFFSGDYACMEQIGRMQTKEIGN